MIPRSERSAQWSLKYARKCSEILSEKLRAKFPATAHGYPLVKIARLDDAFSEFFELEARPIEGQSLQQKDKKSKIKRDLRLNSWI